MKEIFLKTIIGIELRGKVVAKKDIEILDMAYAMSEKESTEMNRMIVGLGALVTPHWDDCQVYVPYTPSFIGVGALERHLKKVEMFLFFNEPENK